jgi:phosphonate transport system substrate-binding protein
MHSPLLVVVLTIAVAVSLNLPSSLKAASATSTAEPASIRLGIVSTKPADRIEEYRDFTVYIGQKLAPGMKGRVVVASDPDQLAKLIQEKKVDFYMESAYPTFLINEQTGAKILLRRWKGRVAEYSALLLTKRDSGMTQLKDLVGNIIAFEDRGSTSGYLLPRAFLAKRGFKLAEKSSFADSVSPQEIGYIFSHGSEKNIINWVLLKKVAAGAFNSTDFDRLGEKRKNEFSILAETEKLPRHLLSVRRDLDAALVQRLREILLTMDQNELGAKALKKADRTSKFDLLPGGEAMVYQNIRELFRLVHKNKP